VISHNGAQAHTTPVYVVREGYRFWNTERAQYVIDRCRGVIDDMEKELNHFMYMYKKDQFPQSNLYGPMTARMAPEAIDIFQKVRKIYQKLEDTLKEEKKKRDKSRGE
jgi:hypothetical protein